MDIMTAFEAVVGGSSPSEGTKLELALSLSEGLEHERGSGKSEGFPRRGDLSRRFIGGEDQRAEALWRANEYERCEIPSGGTKA